MRSEMQKECSSPVGNGRCLLACILLHSVFCLRVWGQYSLDWFSVDGGGGTSTGGVYTVLGAIGQPDAGPTMTGGNYSLDGGFWSITATARHLPRP
jgi:hypothetical protein